MSDLVLVLALESIGGAWPRCSPLVWTGRWQMETTLPQVFLELELTFIQC